METSRSKELKILVQNIWGVYMPYFDCGAHFSARLRKIAEISRSYDIVFFQEFFYFKLFGATLGEYYLDTFTKMVEDALPYSTVEQGKESLPQFFGGNHGLVAFSKYPISYCYSEVYKVIPTIEWNSKGFSHTKIQLPNFELDVINTHLVAYEHYHCRELQCSQLLEYRDKIIGNNNPLIILGDFNISPRISAEGFDNLLNKLKPLALKSNPEIATCYDFGKNATYDHVFMHGEQIQNVSIDYPMFKTGLKNTREMIDVSDHHGMSITIKLCL